jgi:hypothetical protein
VGTDQTSKIALQDCLVDQYVSILKYLLHAKQHLEHGFESMNFLNQLFMWAAETDAITE